KTAKKISPGQRTASSVSWSPTLTSDAADYAPGTTAKLTGTGFLPNETVRVQVLHANYVEGDPIGEDHEPWYVTANENGNFETTWHVCEDDCVGQTLRATADGQDPAGPVRHAEVLFTDSNPPLEPDLIITSLSSSGPFCRGSVFTIYFTTGNNGDVYNAGNVFTAQLGNGGGNWPNSPDILGTLTLSGTSPLTGQITATIPLDYNGVGSSHNIRIVASNPDVEGADYGTEILIGSPPNDYNVTGGGAFCPDNATGLNVGLQDSQEPFTDNNKTYNFTYQLYLNGSPIGSPLIGTGSALDFGIQSFAGTYSVIATNGETGCTAPMKNTVTISSSLVAPGLTKSPDVSSVCAGAMLTVTTIPGSGGTGATDQYRYNDGSGFTAWGTTVPSFSAVIGTNTIESRRIASGAGCNTSASNT
ncbi:MAG TPA: hypothetical protein VN763_12415, partial [Saprospiraceae bacterium]|nr:hypothetical protein [Saprospiraceae bacterium]